jgi:predicted metal-dependent hydrolase
MSSSTSAAIDDPECRAPLHPLALRGIELFNAGDYFEAHEELENAWRQETGPVRNLYRGILQVAVAYYHARRGNYVGARKMLLRCRRWLAPFPDICRGIDLGSLRRDFLAIEAAIKRLGPDHISELDAAMFRPIHLVDPGEV